MKDVYVVIGGSGLLGRHIAEQLHNRGDTVAVVDLVQRFNDIPFHHSDISDPEAILTVLKKVGILVGCCKIIYICFFAAPSNLCNPYCGTSCKRR